MSNEDVIEAYLGTGLKNKPGVSSAAPDSRLLPKSCLQMQRKSK